LSSVAKYFDCHFHIINKNFPVVPNQGFMPDAFTTEDYLDRVKAVDLCGGAVVSGSFPGIRSIASISRFESTRSFVCRSHSSAADRFKLNRQGFAQSLVSLPAGSIDRLGRCKAAFPTLLKLAASQGHRLWTSRL
jgi:hypothetical protein